MGESVFEVVKQSVTAREAAELYGIAVGRGGMACCPFHDDRHPSMKVDTRFHCFGCGADGDVIDFTARLYDLSPKGAAEKLAQDFGLSYDSKAPIRRSYVRQKTEAQVRKEKREHGWRVLTDYYHLLRKWEADYSPKTADEDPHPRFLEAVQKKDYMGYLLDTFLDSSTEEQDQWIAEHTAEISAIEGRVNIMADKPTNRERLQQITAGIEQGIKELFESDKYRKYLATMSRFHRYSVNNTMLIYMQRPDATHVAGFNKWRDQFGRNVLKGEKGIRIIAPTPYKKKVEEIKTDPETNAPVLDADGKAIIEEKEIRIPMFKVVSVFDVSQTYGKPLPQLAADLSGNVQQYEVFMEALRRASPVPMEIKPVARDTDGFFSIKAQSITIRAGMSEVQTVCAAVHEIAHAKLHDYEHMTELADDGETILVPGEKSRNTEEVEAESISYAVCQYYGIETGENSFGYIATWSKGKELKELRASLETINKTASELITDIDRHFAEICRERGISVEKSEQAESQLKENSNMSAADLAKSISELYLDANGLAFLSEFASQEDCLQHFYEDLLTGADEIKGFLSETLEQSDEYAHRANELLLEVEAFQKSHTSLKELDANERWYAVDGGSKHLRITEDGAKYAYELYDKDTLHLLESGTVHDDDVNFLLAAAIRICETHGYDKTVPFEVLSNKFAGILYSLELSSDDNQVVHEEAGSRAAGTLPTSPELEQATPMPDPTLTVDDMRSYGYLDGDMLPLSKDRALELLEHDITVYMLHPDNAEEMVFEAEDIIKHDGMFGITRPDWDAVKGHIPPRDVEQRFLNSPTDSMAIYQLRRDAPVELRFASLGSLAAPPDPANYEAIYTREVYPDDDTGRILENFYYIFNDERPGDFVGHSLSVSDIVALKQDGKVSYHYCDSMGFQELPAFQKPENYLKAAEMSMEDDYGMIDGIINNGPKQPTVADLEAQVKAGMSISLMDLAAAAHRERDAGERKPSVLEQLKNQPVQERPHKTAPKKSVEKEL